MSKSFNEDQLPLINYIIHNYRNFSENEILELIDNVVEDNINDRYNESTLLLIAVEKNHVNVVKRLLEFATIGLNVIGPNGYPLYIAYENKFMEIFEMLFDDPRINVNFHGIYYYISINSFSSVLHMSYYSRDLAFFKYILKDERINPNIIEINNALIHDISISKNSAEYLQALLDNPNTNINLRQKKTGKTALHIAILHNCIDNVKEILKYPNLDINIRNLNEYTALDWAKMEGYEECVKLIEDYIQQN